MPRSAALDWLVSFEGAVGKRVALVNAWPRARHARDSMAEILTTMSLDLVADACIALPLHAACVTEQAMLASEEVRQGIAQLFRALGET